MPRERIPFPIVKPPETEEDQWNFVFDQQEELKKAWEKHVAWLEKDTLFREQVLVGRARLDTLEAKYLEEYKDDEATLAIVKEHMKVCRDTQAAFEAAYEKATLAYADAAEKNTILEEEIAELHQALRTKRH